MCRGREEEEDQRQGNGIPSLLCSNTRKEDEIHSRPPLFCELCSAKATLYCQADDAFLCQKCDRWVHGANFLAQRHIRCLLCTTCNRLTQRYLVGTSAEVILPTVVRLKNQIQGRQCNNSSIDSSKDPNEVKKPLLFL